jgi:hypothetical protein
MSQCLASGMLKKKLTYVLMVTTLHGNSFSIEFPSLVKITGTNPIPHGIGNYNKKDLLFSPDFDRTRGKVWNSTLVW